MQKLPITLYEDVYLIIKIFHEFSHESKKNNKSDTPGITVIRRRPRWKWDLKTVNKIKAVKNIETVQPPDQKAELDSLDGSAVPDTVMLNPGKLEKTCELAWCISCDDCRIARSRR